MSSAPTQARSACPGNRVRKGSALKYFPGKGNILLLFLILDFRFLAIRGCHLPGEDGTEIPGTDLSQGRVSPPKFC